MGLFCRISFLDDHIGAGDGDLALRFLTPHKREGCEVILAFDDPKSAAIARAIIL
jgi:hypothetical protein